MEFNWKIVSTDDTTHSMIVAYWTTEHPEQIRLNIVAPPVGVDLTEYVTQFVPTFDKPTMVYQTISAGVEGTATITQTVTETPTIKISVDNSVSSTSNPSTFVTQTPEVTIL